MKFLILLGYIVGAVPALAQHNSNQHRTRFGFAAGTTLTNLEIVADPSFYQVTTKNQPPLGFRVGVLVSYRFSDRFFLSGQLSYLYTKCNISIETILGNGFTVVGNYKETNEWIEMPIDVNYTINPKSKTKVFVGAGISWLYLAATTSEDAGTTKKLSFNAAALIQVGADIPVGNHTLRIVVSMDRTLMDVVSPDSYSPPGQSYATVEYDYRYTTLSLTARYLF